MTKDFRIFLKGEECTNKVIKYQKVGKSYHVIFNNGKQYTYADYNVRIIESALKDEKSKSCFEYLKDIARTIGLTQNGENILLSNYNKIDFIDMDSMLGKYISNKLQNKVGKYVQKIIYPFGFNNSQALAVERALSNELSIIQGPPGTGKTQTILNIIANIVMRRQSVAVVSSNNSATKNVLDKLKKYDVDFIAAFLGNLENKQEFIKSQSEIPNISNWKINAEQFTELNNKLKDNYKELQEKLDIQNKLALLKQEFSNVELEQKHFLEYYKTLEVKQEPRCIRNSKTSLEMLDMIFACENYKEISHDNIVIKFLLTIFEYLKFWNRKRLILHNLIRKKKYSLDFLKAQFQQKFYELKTQELKSEIKKLNDNLLNYDFASKMKAYSELSAKMFKHYLSVKYNNLGRERYKLEDLKLKSNSFIDDYPIILSTTYSLKNCLSNDVMYDYIIIDEASQVDLCTGALALACARKAVIVGDLKQLPNVVNNKTAEITDNIFKQYQLNEAYRYKNHCLLSSITELFKNIPKTLLKEHYRCHPKIIEFCNKKFYNNELIILSDVKSSRMPLVLCYTTEGNHARNHYNQRQIDMIVNEIIPKYNICLDDNSLGIVTPYRNQTDALQKTFKNTTVKADTVDKFQGQENKVIIISTVDNEISDFTDNPNRLNVAISRAIEQLILVINPNEMSKDKNINDLVNYIKYNNLEICDSKLYSVFDYLYKCYEQRKQEILKKHKKISQYDSENLMYIFINKIINKYYPNQFNVTPHVMLKTILKDKSLLTTNRELQYVLNNSTHIDFLIYKNIDKSPFLAIEVDGYKYHSEGTKQAQRDILKNEILKKYGIPLLRFKTNGSNEQEILITTINNINI